MLIFPYWNNWYWSVFVVIEVFLVKCVFVRSAGTAVSYKSNPAKASKAFEEKGGTWSCNTNTTQPSPSTPILGTFQTFLRYSWEFFDGFESVIGYYTVLYSNVAAPMSSTGMLLSKVTFHALRSLPTTFYGLFKILPVYSITSSGYIGKHRK